MNFKDRAKLKNTLANELTIIGEATTAFIERPEEYHQLTVREFAVIYNAVSQLGNVACEYAFKHLNLGMCQDKYKTLAGGSLRKPELINVRFAKKDAVILNEIDDCAKEFMRQSKKVYNDDCHYHFSSTDSIFLGHALSQLQIAYDGITW